MNKPVIAITGSTGFVGSALVAYLSNQGFQIISLARTLSNHNVHRYYDLENELPMNFLTGIDILIHCAFSKVEENPHSLQTNFEGTKRLISVAKKCRVKKILFFTTVSAHQDATSSYGKSKLLTEELFYDADAILQCSLIIGGGGLFKRILDYTLSHRLIPLPNNGNYPMQVIAIDDVLKSVLLIINNNLCGRFILANKEQLRYKDLFKTISDVYKRRLFFLPISIKILKLLTKIGTLLKIRLPYNEENIAGLETLKEIDPTTSLAKLGLNPMSLKEKLIRLKQSENI
jgi:nucleoside-diphosphate-sugar epimerase